LDLIPVFERKKRRASSRDPLLRLRKASVDSLEEATTCFALSQAVRTAVLKSCDDK
jgi:hypothetical protein